jgi:hypothetical protein
VAAPERNDKHPEMMSPNPGHQGIARKTKTTQQNTGFSYRVDCHAGAHKKVVLKENLNTFYDLLDIVYKKHNITTHSFQ